MKITITLFFSLFAFYACGAEQAGNGVQADAGNSRPVAAAGDDAAGKVEATPAATVQTGPRTVMDFFALLPEKYFTLEGCDKATDKECKKAREDYIKTYGEVVDVKNGYFKGGCDGAQSCIEMAIFKRPDGTYLVGVATFAEMMNDFYFLDYADGKWADVSAEVVPEYSKKNWYELPRVGTTMKVFSKKIVEETDDYEVSDKGRLMYELAWKDGKFTKK
ncbi:MAG: hypothetical protein QUS14_03690 [Pyrinomonadaceae bacterium]|nr:hypothetical protein [Pyrinomonadaceae bacterium]